MHANVHNERRLCQHSNPERARRRRNALKERAGVALREAAFDYTVMRGDAAGRQML